MKTTIFSILAAAITTIGSVSTSNAATTLANLGSFNKIEAHGNVEVYILKGDKNQVTVNNDYYTDNAFVQNEDGTLRIASYKNEKLVVYVTAADVNTIEAFDNAEVKSNGTLQTLDLQVKLHDTAYANLKLDNIDADITVSDQAKADIAGMIDNY